MSLSFIGETQTEVIARQLAEDSTTGREQREFLSTVIAEFESSTVFTNMGVAKKYYKNENDILNSVRTVIGRDPTSNQAVPMESTVLSNNKLCHGFVGKLTRQKIAYLLGRPFTLAAAKKDDELAKAFFAELETNYFDLNFLERLHNISRDAILKTIGWMLVYYDEEGNLKNKRVNAEEVIPFWADSDHTELDAVVRKYCVEQYKAGKKTLIKYVDYYTLEGVYHYVYNDTGKLVVNTEKAPISPHFTIKVVNEEGAVVDKGVNWSRIPLIPWKYDSDESSLLTRIKTLVDDYDRKTSDISNEIDDFPNSQLVVRNYDGDSKEEFTHNKNQYRVMFVQGDGDAKALDTPIDIEGVDVHIKRLKEDIYEFGQGVDTANKDIRDTSGVALRFLYSDLDMDCVFWGAQVTRSLMSLIWFMQQDIIAKKQINYTNVKYNIIFNTDVIVNESETIQNCFMSKGVISDKTIAANHPWTVDADKEIEDMRADQEDTLDLEAEYGKKASAGKENKPASSNAQ